MSGCNSSINAIDAFTNFLQMLSNFTFAAPKNGWQLEVATSRIPRYSSSKASTIAGNDVRAKLLPKTTTSSWPEFWI